ncbi:MAG: hypothetical protein ACKPJO_31290 [Dolichospermum sp.]
MNATQLANVLQNIKTDPVLQETLRVTKQDWVELNLTTQETFYGVSSVPKNANEISDYEIENTLASNTEPNQTAFCSKGCSIFRWKCDTSHHGCR